MVPRRGHDQFHQVQRTLNGYTAVNPDGMACLSVLVKWMCQHDNNVRVIGLCRP